MGPESSLFIVDGLNLEHNDDGVLAGRLIYGGGDVEVRDVEIRDNKADGLGGGLVAYGPVRVTGRAALRSNVAEDGGGFFASGKFARVVVASPGGALAVEDNIARRHGGGVYLEDRRAHFKSRRIIL